jgi:preprotein translocase subunit SecA
MKKSTKEKEKDISFTKDNSANIRKILGSYKNLLICGIEGVGKITETVKAVRDNTNVYYLGNPVDYEGKMRPGSYEKYLKYIISLKKDIKIAGEIDNLFGVRDDIVLIIDEIYGRSSEQLEKISRLLDKENIRIVQIVGCMKYMGDLINKIDIILELHLDGAFIIDKELGRAICSILGKK